MNENRKGWFHLFLAVSAAAEYFSSKNKHRSALLGAMCGWHLVLSAEHFIDTEGNASFSLERARRAGF